VAEDKEREISQAVLGAAQKLRVHPELTGVEYIVATEYGMVAVHVSPWPRPRAAGP